MEKLKNEAFSFNRTRGIVWVCDIVNSSKYLNDLKHTDYLEEFLIRFHWFSRRIVSASGGQYIKWTGDGFMAWYECPLKINLNSLINQIVDAAWQTTFITNITQMGLTNDIKISIRNSITFEEDALLTSISSNENNSVDILGRGVVLCFRLSSITSKFPNIILHGDLVSNNLKYSTTRIDFNKDEINKYFKGEVWETDNVFKVNNIQNRDKSERNKDVNEPTEFHYKIQEELQNGPEWTKELLKIYIEFLKNMQEIINKIKEENI
jgi:hypothetical protein